MHLGSGDANDFQVPRATVGVLPALRNLIERSGILLLAGFYTPKQAHATTHKVLGVDPQRIEDSTYFAIEDENCIGACGGWSMRSTACGGDKFNAGPDRLIDTTTEPAKIRVFFVAPCVERKGLGSLFIRYCTGRALAVGLEHLQ